MKKLLASLCVAASVFGVTLSPIKATAEEYPELKLRFALYISNNIPQAKIFQWWGDELKRRSGGKIDIEFFWSQSLGKSTELLELVSSGAVNLASPSPGYYASKLPLVNITQLPMAFPTNASALLAAEDILELDGVKEEHARNNVVPVMWSSLPTYHLLCNKEIRTLEDFKGAKMRSYGEYVPQMWDALGAVSVTVLAPEIYEGLHRGAIDCSYLPDDFSYAYKLHEVSKYLITANFGAITAWPIYANADQWKSWPENVKELFVEVGAEALERDRLEVRASGEAAIEKMLASGVEKVEFTQEEELRAQVPDFIDVWQEEMDRLGYGDSAKEVANAARKRIAEAK
ncbi:C4-dicarboxylate TRAP transporter substrate-binding protein [Sneathiella sp. HT1-7]|uniref:C4-dicarboxylate TRAP transporter substrate-binding protein n=1 Tax=Sneathiella sp. HT1-7 TaxID=2887192 RepID=UPI001D1376B2|nr:C4-dicarboxylate TRAP transporter substrate-binding protein [Sneathiella sp. HT1-7]MCC3306202.1 C4-dicarboxylate TRAP transporter substrate-binding protein [Sneathiella sp. HT1-7]